MENENLWVHRGFLNNLTGDYEDDGEVSSSKKNIENLVIRYENEKNKCFGSDGGDIYITGHSLGGG